MQADLGADQPLGPDAQRRHVLRPHGGVADDDRLAAQPLPVRPDQPGQVRRPGLLRSLVEQLDRHKWRSGTGGGQAGAQPEGVEEDLPLAVGGAPPDELLAALGRGERRGLSLFQRASGRGRA